MIAPYTVLYIVNFWLEMSVCNFFDCNEDITVIFANITYYGAVAHGRGPSQKIAQLLNNKSLDYIFIPTCRELNSLSICGLWFVVTCYAGGHP